MGFKGVSKPNPRAGSQPPKFSPIVLGEAIGEPPLGATLVSCFGCRANLWKTLDVRRRVKKETTRPVYSCHACMQRQ